MKKAAIYIRVSTIEQAQEGYSIGEQKERLIAYCKAQDWIIADIYIDGGYSGSNLKRPAIQKLMSETHKFDIVLVHKLDRLSRSQRDTLYLIEEIFLPNKIDFVSMQESFDTSSPFGKAMIGLLAVFAQLEREQIKERTQMGRLARAKQGLYHGGGQIPIGYNYENGKLQINPYEAEQIRKIFDWYISGDSFKTILSKLQNAKYTTKYGEYNNWSSIRYILNNETYTGRMSFGTYAKENAHEAIVTKEEYHTVLDIMARKKEQYKCSFRSKYLLTGMLFCGRCGARFYIKANSKYRYYACYTRTKHSTKMLKPGQCDNDIWKKDELEGLIESKVSELLRTPNALKDLVNKSVKTTKVQPGVATLEKRIKEIDKQIEKLMLLYQKDNIPANILSDNISKLYNEKTNLEKSITSEMTSTSTNTFDLASELLKSAALIWDFADEEQKRRILQSLITRITLDGKNVNIEWKIK